jgi:hypothetical protein
MEALTRDARNVVTARARVVGAIPLQIFGVGASALHTNIIAQTEACRA